MIDDVTRSRLVQEAMTWIGTPWMHRGTVKGAGVDCGQLLALAAHRVGAIDWIDPGDYPADWMLHNSVSKFQATVERYAYKKSSLPLPGDIALFNFGRCISHGAMIIEWPKIIHAYRPAKMVVLDDAETNPILKTRLAGFWEIKA